MGAYETTWPTATRSFQLSRSLLLFRLGSHMRDPLHLVATRITVWPIRSLRTRREDTRRQMRWGGSAHVAQGPCCSALRRGRTTAAQRQRATFAAEGCPHLDDHRAAPMTVARSGALGRGRRRCKRRMHMLAARGMAGWGFGLENFLGGSHRGRRSVDCAGECQWGLGVPWRTPPTITYTSTCKARRNTSKGCLTCGARRMIAV